MSRLERVTYFFLIALCLLSGSILIRDRFFPVSQGSFQQPSPASLIGKELDIPHVDWTSSKLHAVLFLSTHCRFCEASMPFYRRMVSQRRVSGRADIPFLAISAEPGLTTLKHLSDNDVAFDNAYQIPFPNTLLKETPILLIVDNSGIIRKAEIGQLDPPREKEVMQIIETGQIM